jgi:glyoxylase-like metal-dependent hydrolase (beta-lactamase superfamily II)
VKTRREFLRNGVQWAVAAQLAAPPCVSAAADAAIRVTPLMSGMWLLDGAGCNVLALKGDQGSLLVDGGYAKHSKQLLKSAARATGNSRVATLINTHWHPAQTGSNEAVGNAGAQIIAHEVTRLYLSRSVTSTDYDGMYGPLAPAGRPTKTTRTTGSLIFDGRQIDYGYLPAAHTNGDLYVHFPEANLIVGGGPVASVSWPLLDWRNGAWLGGLVKAHEKLAAMARPDTRVIPANGRVLSGAELKAQHQLFAAFHEKMVVFLNKGMDSGDCIAARPLQEYEAQYGDPKTFIHGAFQSLNLAYSPD